MGPRPPWPCAQLPEETPGAGGSQKGKGHQRVQEPRQFDRQGRVVAQQQKQNMASTAARAKVTEAEDPSRMPIRTVKGRIPRG